MQSFSEVLEVFGLMLTVNFQQIGSGFINLLAGFPG